MANQPSYAGEFFDLSITSINNDYGALHNIGVMVYGINFPLGKFIKELEMIISESADDKTTKRENRLAFLRHCNSLPALQNLFRLFCNYLNGQDGTGRQYSNFIVITAAGGNIIIVFAQLIMNMIYAFTSDNQNPEPHLTQTNKILLKQTNPRVAKIQLLSSIQQHFSSDPAMLGVLQEIAISPASDCDFKLSPNIFQTRDQESENLVANVTSTFTGMEVDSQSSLAGMEVDSQSGSPSGSQIGGTVDEDIQQLLTMFSKLSVNPEKREEFKFIEDLLSRAIKNKNNAGFLLFRAKTVIDCRKYYKPPYTPKQLKKCKQSCPEKYKELYPQIIQQQHLDEASDEIEEEELDPNCLIYLNHLMEKKQAIKNSTQHTIAQIIQLFIDGYFKQANISGSMFPVIPPSANNTEAIIAYTRNITFNINAYIRKWFTVTLTSSSAPARRSLNLSNYNYKLLVECFLSLDNMIKNDDLIPRLCADILNYFLNDPSFHTETILDELIVTFNTSRRTQCVMLPSDILLVPTEYQKNLSIIKEILNDSLNSELGYPDGLRITINAIITQKIKNITAITSMLNSEEKAAHLIEYQDIIKSRADEDEQQRLRYEQQRRNDPDTTRRRDGGYNRGKKNITLKNKKMVKNIKVVKKTQEKLKTKPKKTRRQKNLRKVTLKHKKSRKHKSIKHKYRKHKL